MEKSEIRTTRRARDASRSRRALLDVAERLFAERGFEATTMADIGAAAELSAGAAAYFFGSKEQLYRAALGRAFEETSPLIRSWSLGESPLEDTLGRAVGSYLEFLRAHPNFVRLVIRDALDGGPFLTGLPEHLAALAEALAEVVGEQGRGRLRSDMDPAHLLLSGISLCWFPLVATALTSDLGFQADSKEFVEARRQQICELLLHGALDQS
jgi:TetR/AcrR family transcriptional regulator